MTTKPATATRPGLPVAGIAAALMIWFAGMVMAALVIQPTAVVAFGDPVRLSRAAIADNATLLNAGPAFLALRPASSSTVRQLYAGGAWLVWPVLSAGCFNRTRS